MKLYHYTKPGNVMMISGQGLQPRAHENNAHMTGGVPVVWLTAEPSIIVTEADIAHMMRAVGHTGDKKLGDLYFGGPARLTVELPRHDKRLARYADFMRKRLNRLSEGLNPDGLDWSRANQWWIYRGTIPPHKIDATLPAAQMIECLDHHIATHPDLEAREDFKAMRQRFADLPADYPCYFNVAEEHAAYKKNKKPGTLPSFSVHDGASRLDQFL